MKSHKKNGKAKRVLVRIYECKFHDCRLIDFRYKRNRVSIKVSKICPTVFIRLVSLADYNPTPRIVRISSSTARDFAALRRQQEDFNAGISRILTSKVDASISG